MKNIKEEIEDLKANCNRLHKSIEHLEEAINDNTSIASKYEGKYFKRPMEEGDCYYYFHKMMERGNKGIGNMFCLTEYNCIFKKDAEIWSLDELVEISRKEYTTHLKELINYVNDFHKVVNPTTIIDWLQSLPEPYRSQAIHHAYHGCNTIRLNDSCNNMGTALVNAFCWKDTMEGYEYWHKYYYDYITE